MMRMMKRKNSNQQKDKKQKIKNSFEDAFTNIKEFELSGNVKDISVFIILCFKKI